MNLEGRASSVSPAALQDDEWTLGYPPTFCECTEPVQGMSMTVIVSALREGA